MRSRYTAYTLCDVQYLTETWHPDHCPQLRKSELEATHWLKLEVVNHKKGLKTSLVEFKAFYETDGQEHCIHEVSTFKKLKNRWVYLFGDHS
jgi:SEC-C motif-containing protein